MHGLWFLWHVGIHRFYFMISWYLIFIDILSEDFTEIETVTRFYTIAA